MSSRSRRTKQVADLFPALRFDRRLVLYQWMLRKLRVTSFDAIAEQLKDERFEGFDEDNISHFFHRLTEDLFDREVLTKDILLGYDQNIVRHWKWISERRTRLGQVPNPKYFQYLSLLFAEMYLDQYFRDRSRLLFELNRYVTTFNKNIRASDQVKPFIENDLNKLALWEATGSGKTLLMHVNILQFKHYLALHGQGRSLNKIILLTPNEGLSRQHLGEFALSRMEAELFSKDQQTLFTGKVVEIIDIHKLKEDSGDKTVAIEAFEGNNLVLVDEGHRGASGVDWMSKRNHLCENGFSFEYSATFGQAIKSAKDEELAQEYAKCIIFDYSYKYFYNDGYGKDYRILNLADDSNPIIRHLYLTGSVLAYYQQLRLYLDKKKSFSAYLLEKPLLVFVGSRVKAVRVENKRKVSDVLDSLLFLSDFVRNSAQSIEAIQQILYGTPVLLNTNQQYVFANQFTYLMSQDRNAEEIFRDLLKITFNIDVMASLHVDHLKGSDGELGVRFGENPYFGVINIGDPSDFIDLCEEQSELVTSEKPFSESLFRSLDDEDSSLNVLIGAKKFTEGWNSYRVTTMGLLNVGKTEGSEIIQLFGRGVRLRGFGNCLKRSAFVPGIRHPEFIEKLETLNVFGIRSNYMQQFKEYLEEEGMPSGDAMMDFVMPVISNLGTKKLKILRIKNGTDFKKDGPKPKLEQLPYAQLRYPVELDWYPMIQSRQSKGVQDRVEVVEKKECKLTKRHMAFFDIDRILSSLVLYKNEKSWYNLCLSRDAIERLLLTEDWYTLYIDPEEMTMKDFGRIQMWEEIALLLLQKYTDRYYKFRKDEYEAPFLEYQDLTLNDLNFFEEYRLSIEQSQTAIIQAVKHVKEMIDSKQLQSWQLGEQFHAIAWGQHLYEPLLYVKSDFVNVRPVPLNMGERDFVLDLVKFHEANKRTFDGKEIYLLRNLSRGRGMGFFEAGNFYPDFVMWLVFKDRQSITFIDPKGIRNRRGNADPKIQFSSKIKKLEERLHDPNIVLDSFIISLTPYQDVSWWGDGMTEEEFEKQHVLFKSPQSNQYLGRMFRELMPQ